MSNRPSSFDYNQLLACGRGEMFAEGPQLPLPPMLMFDRISEISEQGGEHGKGMARGEPGAAGLVFLPLPLQGRSGDAGLSRPRRLVATRRLLSGLARIDRQRAAPRRGRREVLPAGS